MDFPVPVGASDGCVSQNPLYGFKIAAADNRLMHIFCDVPLAPVYIVVMFIPEMLCSLEVDYIAAILLPREDMGQGGFVPLVAVILVERLIFYRFPARGLSCRKWGLGFAPVSDIRRFGCGYYESEQKELLATVESDEQTVKKAEQEKVDLKVFLDTIRKYTDLKELTPTIVNTLIKRIDVHNSVKDDNGVKHVPIDISFTAVGIINVPTEKELITAMEKMREKPLKTA